MSILIKGIQMPKNGWTDVRLHCDGSVTMPTGNHPYFRLLTAVEIPEEKEILVTKETEKIAGHNCCPCWHEDEKICSLMGMPIVGFTPVRNEDLEEYMGDDE